MMKSRYTEQEDQIITSVADMYSSTGKGLNKAKRALRKKFSITVSEGELRRRLEALKKNRERHT